MERWKDIDGFGNKYAISDKGRVLSKARVVSNHTGTISKPDRILKISKDIKGYSRVFLSDCNGTTKFIPIHRLVAKAFIPNPDNKPQVNHIDGDKTNNHVSNLEWVTNRENQLHAVRTGLNDHSKYHSGRPFRAVLQIDPDTQEIINRFPSITKAAESIGCKSSSNIGGCARGVRGRKTVYGYEWKFESEVM